jgi:hypothetical protein
MTEITGGDRWVRRTTTVAVVVLAGIAAAVSYRHMHELALRHGEGSWTAVLIPLSVDGMVVASSMSVLMASRSGRRAEFLPWALLVIGSLASLAANVAVAEPTLIGQVIAAWPSFAFVGAYELLQNQLRTASASSSVSGESRLDGLVEPVAQRGGGDGEVVARADSPTGRRLQRQAWRWALESRNAEGELPTGEAIASAFQRSPRWGRLVKRAGTAGELG